MKTRSKFFMSVSNTGNDMILLFYRCDMYCHIHPACVLLILINICSDEVTPVNQQKLKFIMWGRYSEPLLYLFD